MPWRVYVATHNTVHSEDDVAYWLSSDSSWGAVAVADGVSATSGGGASFLAVNAFIHACRLHGARGYSGIDTMESCLDYVSRVARAASPSHADVIEALKKNYYSRCGQPCTRPLTLDLMLEEKPSLPEKVSVHREAQPSTTLLAALLHGDKMLLAISGDGSIIGVTGQRSEEVFLLWGAIPQLFAGSKVARFVEIGRGIAGKPLVLETRAYPGAIYAIATDGVDVAALAEALLDIVRAEEKPENPAEAALKAVGEKTGFEDDATLALIIYTG